MQEVPRTVKNKSTTEKVTGFVVVPRLVMFRFSLAHVGYVGIVCHKEVVRSLGSGRRKKEKRLARGAAGAQLLRGVTPMHICLWAND